MYGHRVKAWLRATQPGYQDEITARRVKTLRANARRKKAREAREAAKIERESAVALPAVAEPADTPRVRHGGDVSFISWE